MLRIATVLALVIATQPALAQPAAQPAQPTCDQLMKRQAGVHKRQLDMYKRQAQQDRADIARLEALVAKQEADIGRIEAAIAKREADLARIEGAIAKREADERAKIEDELKRLSTRLK